MIVVGIATLGSTITRGAGASARRDSVARGAAAAGGPADGRQRRPGVPVNAAPPLLGAGARGSRGAAASRAARRGGNRAGAHAEPLRGRRGGAWLSGLDLQAGVGRHARRRL